MSKLLVKTTLLHDGRTYPRGDIIDPGKLKIGKDQLARLQAVGAIATASPPASSESSGKPSDPAQVTADIVAAVPGLDEQEGYTTAGEPSVAALSESLGYGIDGDERDAGWAAFKEANPDLFND